MIKTGTILGDRYEILEKIGTGGMAEVFKGKDHKLNRYVAVKVLKEEFRDNDGFVKKFKEEAQAAAGLAHPNIVNVYDVGDENGIYYIVMELVEGITLKNYIERKGRLTIKEATSIAIQVSAGLEVAHNNHIVHRDIKPQNIIISREGKVKVTDFGIAKATTSQTTTSSAMGSVHYASPEQARGGYVDHRSDIYSLGIVMYEMVTGRVPFDGETAVTVAVKHLQEQMVPPSEYCPEIPYSLEQIIKKCTEKSPDRRYQDIGDLMADLKQSLVDPDGDFVQMVDLDEQAKTVIMTKGTTSKVKESRRVNLSKDEDEDDEEEDEDSEDDEDDEELSPTVERAMTIAGVVLAVIIVIIMLLLFSKVLGIGKKSNTDTSDSQQTEQSADEEDDSSSASQGNTVNMPSLLGKTYAEARTVLEELGLKIERGESEKSNQYSAGQIIAQSEESGNSVKVGTTVTVTLAAAGSTASSDGTSSTGSTTSGTTTTTTNSKVTVPPVVGKDENAAKSAITTAGLTVGTVSEASSDTVESGLVISQSPSANSETESGGKVNIVLSSGPNKKKVTDVIGHESSRAQSELAGDGFKVEVKETYSNDMRAGLVVSTSPDRGTYVQPGSTVTITVSKGREQVTIPSVSVGMTYEEAVEALNDAGFKGTVKEATEYSASVGNGFVTRYSPSKTVDPDGTVTIYVSLGTQSTTE
ncbi:MAG: Stk1 family PASTA domain-containing Ser/Thr kinase [Clostridiaceae bacterium]|nr:Stk1 family PASTA domain-containing Ser/Thr kinase [Clostridiaceae bacterium]